MPTHDYSLANQSGASFRTDLNNALAAIQSNNSNSSSPATTVAYQWWADTSAGTLKIRNSSNNAWIELFQLDGTLTLEDGSASSPALGFRDDLNTGIFSAGADTFNVATGGAERLEISGSQTIFNDAGAEIDFRIESDTKTHMFFMDSSANAIGINTSAPACMLHITDTGAGGDGVLENLRLNSAQNNTNDGNKIQFSRINGASGSISCVKVASNNTTDMIFGTRSFNTESETMRLTGAGKLGIGLTPTSALHVKGAESTLKIEGTLSTSNVYLDVDAADNRRGVIRFQEAGTTRWSIGRGDSDELASTSFFIGSGSTGGGAAKLVIDSTGKVGIAVTDPDKTLEVAGTAAATDLMVGRSGSQFPIIQRHTAASGSQSLLITGGSGLSTNASSSPTLTDATGGSGIYFSAGNPATDPFGGGIQYYANGSTSPNNPSTGNQHVWYVRTAVNTFTEKMRLDHHGGLRINSTSTVIADELLSVTEDGTAHELLGLRINSQSHNKDMITMAHVANSGDRMFIRFKRTGSLTNVGSINTNPTATAFNTSSDYRLKENEVLITDGITRLKTLKPYRFNFKIEPDKTVDGFFAHEVSSAVPEAITGEKDAVETTYYTNGDTIPDGKNVGDIKEENVILPQGLDYAKFTPLLTAALQEAISKIEVLETKVAALEAA